MTIVITDVFIGAYGTSASDLSTRTEQGTHLSILIQALSPFAAARRAGDLFNQSRRVIPPSCCCTKQFAFPLLSTGAINRDQCTLLPTCLRPFNEDDRCPILSGIQAQGLFRMRRWNKSRRPLSAPDDQMCWLTITGPLHFKTVLAKKSHQNFANADKHVVWISKYGTEIQSFAHGQFWLH